LFRKEGNLLVYETQIVNFDFSFDKMNTLI